MEKKTVFTEVILGCFPKNYRRSFEDMPWDMDDLLKTAIWRTGNSDKKIGAEVFCPFESITVDDSRMFRCYSN